MNLLFLSMTFPDALNRSRGSYNLALCRELAKEHEVSVCAPRGWTRVLGERLCGRRFHGGVDLESAGIRAAYPCFWYVPRFTQNQSGRILWQSSRRAVEELAARSRPEAVLSYWAHPDGEAGLRAAQRYGAASAVMVGGTDALILPHRRGRGPAVRRVLNDSDAVLTVSEGLRRAVIDLGVPSERVHVTYQGVDPEVFFPGSRREARQRLKLPLTRPILTWVGRMVEIKRLDVLLQACAQLRARGLDFELCLVGSGALQASLRQQSRQLGLTGAIRFVGAVPYHETADWYRAADATVLASDSEGLPNVLRESLACGTPFVSTDVGSIREIAEPCFSKLTPARDVPALAAAIQEMLEGSAGAAAQKFRARTWADCAKDVVGVLRGTPDPAISRERRPAEALR